MTFLQFKKIARWSGLRAALLGAMGLVTLLFSEFLQGSPQIFCGKCEYKEMAA